MKIVTGVAGMRGLDVNGTLGAQQAKLIKDAQFDFVIRYVQRSTGAPTDLSKRELEELTDAGLLVGVVQHVKSETSWVPDVAQGQTYAFNALYALQNIGVPYGCPLWLDLEGVAAGTSHQQVIDYCNTWERIASKAMDPGTYVGWHADLTAAELYEKLKCKRYWGALNLNVDEFPAVRGLQMKQHEATHEELVLLGSKIPPFDTNTVLQDKLGDLPVFIAA